MAKSTFTSPSEKFPEKGREAKRGREARERLAFAKRLDALEAGDNVNVADELLRQAMCACPAGSMQAPRMRSRTVLARPLLTTDDSFDRPFLTRKWCPLSFDCPHGCRTNYAARTLRSAGKRHLIS